MYLIQNMKIVLIQYKIHSIYPYIMQSYCRILKITSLKSNSNYVQLKLYTYVIFTFCFMQVFTSYSQFLLGLQQLLQILVFALIHPSSQINQYDDPSWRMWIHCMPQINKIMNILGMLLLIHIKTHLDNSYDRFLRGQLQGKYEIFERAKRSYCRWQVLVQ